MKKKEPRTKKQAFVRIVILILLAVVIGAGLGLTRTLPADETALAASVSDELVQVSDQPTLFALVPRGVSLQRGMIFYPDARVDPQAYVPLLKPLAEHGILVVIPKMPLGFAFFGINRAAEIQLAYPQVTCWMIGGHSLGGSMAAEYAADHSQLIDGIVFVASYPARNTSLHGMDLQGLLIRGTNDGLVSEADIMAVKDNFPTVTQFIVLDGANHAQFGHYGIQPGDGQATMSATEQDEATSQAILDLYTELEGGCSEVIPQ